MDAASAIVSNNTAGFVKVRANELCPRWNYGRCSGVQPVECYVPRPYKRDAVPPPTSHRS